jgi:hypothetical protein
MNFPPTRQIFWGNILLAVCCAFYLAWWILAFKPVNPIKGFKTGWLLIPASVAGIIAVIFAIHGILSSHPAARLYPNSVILWGGIGVYIVAMILTSALLKRPVTTELILIIGWLMLALVEVNVLMGLGVYTRTRAFVFIAVCCAATIVNLVCYVLFYNLSDTVGFIDGMIPLILVLVLTLGIIL